MSALVTIGSNTVCATTAAEPYLQRMACRRSGIGGCGYVDERGNQVNGHDFVCPSGVYNYIRNREAGSGSDVADIGHGGLSLEALSQVANEIGVVPVVSGGERVATQSQQTQQRQTPQTPQQTVQTWVGAVQAGIDDIIKPTQPVVDTTTYWKPTTQQSYAQASGQQSTSTPQPIQASIIPSGWGWPIAIGGTVIVVGTIIGMWYRNRRGM